MWSCSGHCGMYNDIPGLCMLHASSNPKLWQPKMSLDLVRFLLGDKTAPSWKSLLFCYPQRLRNPTGLWMLPLWVVTLCFSPEWSAELLWTPTCHGYAPRSSEYCSRMWREEQASKQRALLPKATDASPRCEPSIHWGAGSHCLRAGKWWDLKNQTSQRCGSRVLGRSEEWQFGR